MAINIPFFEYSSQDQSVAYLGQIFGPMGTILTPTQAPLIFGKMFNTLNTVILTVGVLIVVYVTIVGVIKTAHEGEPLGKQWSTLWLPLRMDMGIAALVPSASGYSFLQIIIMWVILQGVGAADTVWSATVKWYQDQGSITAKVKLIDLNTSDYFKSLFAAEVCNQSMLLRGDGFVPVADNNNKGAYFCDLNPSNSFCSSGDGMTFSSSAADKTKTIQFGPLMTGGKQTGMCGTVTYCDASAYGTSTTSEQSVSDQVAIAACKAQQKIVEDAIAKFNEIAKSLALVDLNFRKSLTQPGESTDPAALEYCGRQGWDASKCCVDSSNPECKLNEFGPTGTNKDFYTDAGTKEMSQIYWPYLKNQISVSDNVIPEFVNNYIIE